MDKRQYFVTKYLDLLMKRSGIETPERNEVLFKVREVV